MMLVYRFRSILRWAFHRTQVERELNDELQTFIDMSVAEKMRDGLPADQARRLATHELGGVEQVKERVRASRAGAQIDRVVRDLRYACRVFAKFKGFTTVAVLTLAMGIGAATVIYSVADAIQRFIPAVNRRGLVYVASTDARVVRKGTGQRSVVLRQPASIPDFADWMARASSFESFAGFVLGSANLTGTERPVRVSTVRTTANLGDMWGFKMALGRGFVSDDGKVGAAPVALITYRFWQLQFSQSVAVLGTTVQLDGVPHTIVGVLPAEAGAGVFRNQDLFTPLVVDALRGARSEHLVLVTGRLKRDVSIGQASSELASIARQLAIEHPDTNQSGGAVVLPLTEAAGFNVRILLALLLSIAALIVLVASANVASILVAQLASRQREFALRSALGATRADRVRQLLTESALLSASACVVGLLAAMAGVAIVRWYAGETLAFADVAVNRRVVAAAIVSAIAVSVFCGVVPALRFGRRDTEALDDSIRTVGSTVQGRRRRGIMTGIQAAAGIILMVQVGLIFRTTSNLARTPSGFNPAGVLTFRVSLTGPRYAQTAALEQFAGTLVSRLAAVPGVRSAALVDRLPVADREAKVRLSVEGDSRVRVEDRPLVTRWTIAGDFLATMGIPLRRGRTFSTAELAAKTPVAIVNAEAARRFWPDRSPVGERVAINAEPGRERWLEIVGVAGDIRQSDVDQVPSPQVYVPWGENTTRDFAVVLRSIDTEPGQLTSTARAIVMQLDPSQPIYGVATMAKVLADDTASGTILSAVLSAVALLALGLSAAGVYGMISHSVTQRRREIGLRMALGAERTGIVRMIVATAAKPVAVGGVGGFFLAVLVALTLSSGIPEFDGRDPLPYVIVLAIASTVTLAASYVPARLAASSNPVDALREQ